MRRVLCVTFLAAAAQRHSKQHDGGDDGYDTYLHVKATAYDSVGVYATGVCKRLNHATHLQGRIRLVQAAC
jgi:hypothetical protein